MCPLNNGLLPSAAAISLLLIFPTAILAAGAPRGVPTPLPHHPGNVFLEDEDVTIALPNGTWQWHMTDIDGKLVKSGSRTQGQDRIPLGQVGVGWYRVVFLSAEGREINRTTAAVLAKLKEPTPQDSPICTDSATAWFARRYKDQQEAHQENLASLAALAGANWIRDRMAWGEVETAPDTFAENTIYDSSATLQAKHGLKVLQVFHSTPAWAMDKALDGQAARNRFPRDLRHHYSFCKAMAQRFQGRVPAWEPWNEANIEPFGGHTIDEMCAAQKAAYLGLKAGNPDVTACWNVYAGSGSPLHTEGVLANEAWPYFETYNIHSYSKPDDYLRQFETARQGACGRPIWITECGIRLRTEDAKPWGDLPLELEREQAEFVARSYASSLFAGVDRHFFFILGNYIERDIQFGLLRHDHTPRPGYVALAAVGRFLAGAKCLGRVAPTIYAFRARPDGVERDVLVAWGEGTDWPLDPELAVDAVYDHLGRHLGKDAPKALRSSAMFVILPAGEASKLKLEVPPERSAWREGKPSSVVIQASFPSHTTRLGSQAHEVESGKQTDLPLFVYNFSDQPLSGVLAVEETAPGVQVETGSQTVQVQPMGREQVAASATLPETGRGLMDGVWIKLRGDFGPAGRPVLAFRLAPDLRKLRPAETRPIPRGNQAEHWQDNIVRQGKMSHRPAEASGVLFEMQFADTDPWAYPRLRLAPEEVPDNSFDGLALAIQVLEGAGMVRVQFVEENGAAYLTEAGIDSDIRTAQRALVLFRHCKWGAHSKPDPDGKLIPAQIRAILVGINSQHKARVKMAVAGLEWVKF
ncbi:MAG: hypothetical protein AB1696_19570 [Planctomycetota bacterium]